LCISSVNAGHVSGIIVKGDYVITTDELRKSELAVRVINVSNKNNPYVITTSRTIYISKSLSVSR